MLFIRTKLAPSSIHGIGVFSEEFVPMGNIVWKWHDGVDQRVPVELVEALPDVCKEVFKRYSWLQDGVYHMPADSDKYVNHSKTPNCIFVNDTEVAAHDIQIGDEITQNYKLFDENFGNPEFGYDWEVK